MNDADHKNLLRAAGYVHAKLAAMSEEELAAVYLMAYTKTKKLSFSLNGAPVPAEEISKTALPIVLWHAWGVYCYIGNKPRTDLIDHAADHIRMKHPPLSRTDLFLYVSEAVCDMNEALGTDNRIELAPLHNQIMAIKSANRARTQAPSPG